MLTLAGCNRICIICVISLKYSLAPSRVGSLLNSKLEVVPVITDVLVPDCHLVQLALRVEPRPSGLNMTLPAIAADCGRLQQIARYRCVSVDDAKTVSAAWVSRLDYCNSILHGTSSSNLNKLQRVQNARARAVMMTKKRDHITPVLARLHWLPVAGRIQFKIALLTFTTLITHQPSYIHDLLQPHCSSRQLRSASHNLLEIPRMRTDFAQRSFAYSAPRIGNSYLTSLLPT